VFIYIADLAIKCVPITSRQELLDRYCRVKSPI
jgi:hypothetical protein